MAAFFSMTPRRGLELGLLALLHVPGCSLFVDPTETYQRCERADAGPEVCPGGLECRGGRCQPPCARAETCGDGLDNDCDGLTDQVPASVPETCGDTTDNDCDGQIDEWDANQPALEICGDREDNDCDSNFDEGFDHDLDGYTWCGDTLDSTAGMEARDCDDLDPMAYPHAQERCDGSDNDCDDVTDEQEEGSPALCPPGQACLLMRCVQPSCAIANSGVACGPGERCDLEQQKCVAAQLCPENPCAGDEYCDTQSKTCKKRAPSRNGERCLLDEDCGSGSCIDAAALRLAAGPSVCGEACCNDGQCAADERCFASGTGARSCLPKAMVPDTVLTQCTTDAVCQAPELCALNRNQSLVGAAFVARTELITSTCRAEEPAGLPVGESCLDYTNCDSKVCVPRKVLGSVCSIPCGTTGDCEGFGRVAGLFSAPEDAYCRYVQVNALAPPDYAAVCAISRGENGAGGYGAECASPADCRDLGCVRTSTSENGRCTPTCCDASDCGVDQFGRPIACRPYAFGPRYEMRCEP